MTRDGRIRAVLFALVWLSCIWFQSWAWNPNNATRLFAAVSLVEDHDATIDDYAALTIDRAEYRGHTYLDKAPGMTLMALPAVALADAATGDRAAFHDKWFGDPGLGAFLTLRQWLATASGPALLTALAAVLLFDIGVGVTGSRAAALFGTLGYALGTPVWGWSTTLFGHAAVAALYVIAVWAIWRGTQPPRAGGRFALLAGLALGWAVVIEYQAVLAGSAIGLWALWRLWILDGRGRAIGLGLLGGLVAGVPLIAYNLVAYGAPFHLGYQDVVGWEGMHQGLFGLTRPRTLTLIELLVGRYRGIIWVAPIAMVAVFGLARLVLTRATRDLGVMAVAVVATAFLVNASYVYWDGGNATGPRIAMPMAGMLALGLAPVWAHLRWDWERWAAAAVLAGSIALNAMIASAEILAPASVKFAIWDAVWKGRFRPGLLRTLPDMAWGWTPWQGFFAWAAVAGVLLALLIAMVRRRA
jgi:hypothetical protein